MSIHTFICYRHEDASSEASLVANALRDAGGADSVFMDTSSIEAGTPWPERIRSGLDSAGVVVAVIGPRWSLAQDQWGRRKIDVSGDWVRQELASALTAKKTVIPILVGGGRMPPAEGLPTDLALLPSQQAIELRRHYWDHDIQLLINRVLTPEAQGGTTQRKTDKNPILELFELQNAAKAPYMLSSASEVWLTKPPERESAIWELVREIRDLKPELRYLGDVAARIQKSPVSAVCGNKTDDAWKVFLKANLASPKVERVFFPPLETKEVRDVFERHLTAANLTPRVFTSRKLAHQIYNEWNLPVGFGMTLTDAYEDQKAAVLVHWGGDGRQTEQHYGVVLEHPAWTAHFRRLFGKINGLADSVDHTSVDAFLEAKPHYKPTGENEI